MSRSLRLLMLALTGSVLAATAAAQQVRTVAPDRLSAYWRLLNTSVEADIPNTGLNLTKPGCVAVSYMIGADGATRDIQVRKVVPKSDLGSAASSVIRNFHYAPAAGNTAGQAVRTYYIVPFNMPPTDAARQPLIHACDLPGYGQPSA